MATNRIELPYLVFTDVDGNPLENGSIFIGIENLDPVTNPIAVYWDEAATIPVVQPISTIGGYPSKNGSPGNIYTATTTAFSMTVKNKNGSLVTTIASSTNEIDTSGFSDQFVLDIDNYAALQAVDTSINTSVNLKELHVDISGSGGDFFYDATADKSTANQGTIIDPSVSLVNQGTGIGLGCWLRQYTGVVNIKWFGDETQASTVTLACRSGENVKFNIDTAINIPTDFDTIQEALNNIKLNKDIKINIILETGFILEEQVIVNGDDYSFVTLTSEDATVNIDETTITVEVIEHEDVVPIFAGINNATLPVIGVLFYYTNNTVAKDGFLVSHSSKVTFLPSSYISATPISGCKDARRGLTILNGSEAECNPDGLTQADTGLSVGVDFSGCKNRALNIQHGSKATLTKSNFSNSEGDNAVYVIWNSFADIYQSDITGHLGSNAAVVSRDASIVCARETDASNGAVRGYHALHASSIDARLGKAINCGTYGVLASSGGTVDCKELDATGCNIGVHASDSSTVEASGVDCTDCITNGVYARGSSTISFVGGIVSNSVQGIISEDCSNVNASGASIVGCEIGSGAIASSSLNIVGSTNTDNLIGTKSEQASLVNADGVIFTGCVTYGVYASEVGTIQARGVTIDGADINVHAIRGSIINCRSAILTNALSYGVYAVEGGAINAQSANTVGAGIFGIYIFRGSTINAGAATGTLNLAANTLTASGIIYQ